MQYIVYYIKGKRIIIHSIKGSKTEAIIKASQIQGGKVMTEIDLAMLKLAQQKKIKNKY